ncbi:MAG: 4-(cytidine 5'-diphospho)-2-C-methyl-D-erythritol kinase, partial [Ignavibacteriales bacterium]|nr:4-(cytidine 5'-diphospho)-2-C-methyl-D-erythritol kinase [Ignavibacteriales bacterium]
MIKLQINAPAKINLGLYVISKRDDGYHNIETIFYPIYDLCDVITFERSDRFIFISNNSEINNEDNLIVKAKNLLEERTNK